MWLSNKMKSSASEFCYYCCQCCCCCLLELYIEFCPFEESRDMLALFYVVLGLYRLNYVGKNNIIDVNTRC